MKKYTQLEHEKWLAKMKITGKRVRTSPYSLPNLREGLKSLPPTSDAVGNGYKKAANSYTGDQQHIVGLAYNKGNFVVLSPAEASDPATGKRRC